MRRDVLTELARARREIDDNVVGSRVLHDVLAE